MLGSAGVAEERGSDTGGLQRLPINQRPTETVPYDLQRYVSSSTRLHIFSGKLNGPRAQYSRDVWVARQRAVLTKGARYLKPRFEIIFTLFMLLYVPLLTAPLY